MEEETLKEFVRKRLILEGVAEGCSHWYTPRVEYVQEIRRKAERDHKISQSEND